MKLSFLPNLLCILRLLLVYPVALAVLRGNYPLVLALLPRSPTDSTDYSPRPSAGPANSAATSTRWPTRSCW